MSFPDGKNAERRLALYAYLRPLIEGARVFEVMGRPTSQQPNTVGRGAEKLAALGAVSVVSADARAVPPPGAARITRVVGFSPADLERHGPFDLILVPDAESVLGGRGAGPRVGLEALQAVLAPGGRVVLQVSSGDVAAGAGSRSSSGLGYYEVLDRLTPHFASVRIFGQTTFHALGIAEFDVSDTELHVETDLIDPESEEPSHYIALAGPDEGPALGYALVQLPTDSAVLGSGPGVAGARAVGAGAEIAPAANDTRATPGERDRALAELAEKLAEAEGRADGVLRVSRAQAEEIEELRARLRRAAEMRADLDAEVARLRQGLAEADESVMSLTRKTADEMSALAAQLTSGLRAFPAGGRAAPADAATIEQLKQRDELLAQRDSALFERDERVAALEIENQDLQWQLDARPVAAASRSADVALVPAPPLDADQMRQLRETLAGRDRALQALQRGAVMQLRENEALRASRLEQAAYVQELRESVAAAERRMLEAETESARLRAALKQGEEADRVRRARLAELEGLLLRLKREQQAAELRAETKSERESGTTNEGAAPT